MLRRFEGVMQNSIEVMLEMEMIGMVDSDKRGKNINLVGVPGFEPGTSPSRTVRATSCATLRK